MTWQEKRTKMSNLYDKVNHILHQLDDSRYSEKLARTYFPRIIENLKIILEEVKELNKEL